MNPDEESFKERVVEIVETCEGAVVRTFYCIHDPEFGHWMSREPFDGLIWTKDFSCRKEFASRSRAESALMCLDESRREGERTDDLVAEIPWETQAA
ncbi:MAG: hypothetical protein IT442_08520 [Phycisphaeraceae bacterium]|nr:hypothetical protein [Phycisphaeraceae bacterium]